MSARFVLAAALACGALGCDILGEPTPNVGSPNHHSAYGLEFDYPGNWTLKAEVDDTEGFELYTVEVESSGNALAMVQQFKPSLELDAEELMTDIEAGLREGVKGEMGGIFEYGDGTVVDVQRKIVGDTRNGKEKGFHLSALGEKVAHTMQMYPLELEDRSLIVYAQVPDEDRTKAQPGFDQIFDSIVLK